jgi:hypothetical protein
MPLRLASPPSNAYDLVAQAISRVSTADSAAAVFNTLGDPSLISAALPHKVYTLGAEEIAAGRNVDRARLNSWRFLITYGSRTIAAVELLCDALGQNLRFSSFDTGPFAQATQIAVRQAEQRTDVIAGDYELRALKAPSVYAMALWLKATRPSQDIMIPLVPTRAPGEPTAPATIGGGPQSPAEFLAGLRGDAERSIEFHDRPQPPASNPGAGGGGTSENDPKGGAA